MTPTDLVEDRWAFGPWCLVVAEVRLLRVPMPARGLLGWWPLDDAQRRQLFIDVGEVVTSAMTLKQPYASAIATGPKRVENRDQRRRIPEGGLWVGLHAGKELYLPSDWYEPGMGTRAKQADEWCRTQLALWSLEDEGRPALWPEAPGVEELPMGVLLGAMRISQCLPYPEGR